MFSAAFLSGGGPFGEKINYHRRYDGGIFGFPGMLLPMLISGLDSIRRRGILGTAVHIFRFSSLSTFDMAFFLLLLSC